MSTKIGSLEIAHIDSRDALDLVIDIQNAMVNKLVVEDGVAFSKDLKGMLIDLSISAASKTKLDLQTQKVAIAAGTSDNDRAMAATIRAMFAAGTIPAIAMVDNNQTALNTGQSVDDIADNMLAHTEFADGEDELGNRSISAEELGLD